MGGRRADPWFKMPSTDAAAAGPGAAGRTTWPEPDEALGQRNRTPYLHKTDEGCGLSIAMEGAREKEREK